MQQKTEKDARGRESVIRDRPVKFSICAITDLQGFSSHLEISGYDLRTHIGEQAILRLRNLETAVDRINGEKSQRPDYYPSGLHVRRINDAMVIAMDLDDALLPALGEKHFRGLPHGVDDPFKPDEPIDWHVFETVNDAKVQQAIEPLQRFLGLVCRLHLFVERQERIGYYPGAKTIVSTGFRKPFLSASQEEDILSANFAYANAFIADKALKGPRLFVDNHILELLSKNRFAKNILRFAQFEWREIAFDCLMEDVDPTNPPSRADVPQPQEVSLFRRRYVFRRMNASPASYLQSLPSVIPFLVEDRKPDLSNRFYAHIYQAIRRGLTRRMIDKSEPPASFIYNGRNDLDVDVGVFSEFLSSGESVTQKARRRAERLTSLGLNGLDEKSELGKKLKELEEQTVEIDVDMIHIDEIVNELWSLSEEELSAFLPFMEGDFSLLDFPEEAE